MDFSLSPEQKMLAETVKTFVKQRSPVERFRKLRAEQRPWDPEMWAHMGELGWLSVPFSEDAGGFGGGMIEVAIILEGLGKALAPEPYLASVVLAGSAVAWAGNAAQHERWLAPMMEGTHALALAQAERASRYDAARPSTTAVRDGSGWRLSGEKIFVLGGAQAHAFVVSASTPDGLGLFVVDPDGPGVSRQVLRTIDGHGAARLRLDGASVDDDRRLGEPGEPAAAVLDRVLDRGAAGACAEGLGVAQAMLDMTVQHLKDRKQFGVPIGSFQVLQHRAVDMFVEVQLLRSMSVLASIRADEPEVELRQRSVSAAKAKLGTAGRLVSQQAIQLHGGIGITDEHDIGLYFKRMVGLDTALGDETWHVQRLSNLPGFAGA
ncbi:acyl-CoA dehydrogenase family protein [Paraliomyxa miuraensis]|uniref:acyl-CoA dehydrogenase family protein n=1 Tax=Paraliomyxa miuraensis TaxID=376150 RepID=UPI00225A8E40|nr:acyl-CoA dehydrogenase family protein [Paraliomyxa miuraensis]MCX4242598.1 acyl-CoA dehydrogenase family protein [Paraliomyxa miuraensis]